MISFQQKMNRKIKAKSVLTHYLSKKSLFVAPLGGLVLIAFYVVAVMYQVRFPFFSGFILLFGVLFILQPIINMLHTYFDVRTKRGSEESILAIEFDEMNIKTKEGESEVNFQLNQLFKYRVSNNFIFLFSSKNQYFFIDKNQVTQTQIDYMLDILAKLDLKK